MPLFIVCFGVGLGFIVISFILGEALSHFDFDFDFDFDVDSPFDFSAGLSPFKPTIIATFLTVFGGVGIILMGKIDFVFVLGFSFALGFFISFLIYRFVYVPLYKYQSQGYVVEKQALIGHTAKLTEAIPQGGFGKITYYVDGNTYNSPCKSEDGNTIERNSSVEIVYIEKNTYFVRKKQ